MPTTIPPHSSNRTVSPAGRYRWFICSLLFLATSINYMDRQILSLLKPILDQDLHWTNQQFGWINSSFQGAYALSYLFFGWFVDRYGTRIGYAVSIAAWSVAAALHACMNSIAGFTMARIALGLGEGGNFPAAIKAVSQWFPRKERAFATTIFNSGSNVGAILAPALVPAIALNFGWQSAFLVVGFSGFLWLALWLRFFASPRQSGIGEEELRYIESDLETAEQTPPMRWSTLLRHRQTWGYLAARLLTDPVWWFFLIWLPDYFKKTRDMDVKTMGLPLVTIYTLVTILSIAGGWAGKRLTEQGWNINKTRKISLLVFAAGVVPVVFVTHASLWPMVLLVGLAGASHQAWSATLFTTVSDVFPQSAVASVVGLGGLAGSIGGMVFPVLCGLLLDRMGSAGYAFLFGYSGLAYLTAFAVNHLLTPRFEPIR